MPVGAAVVDWTSGLALGTVGDAPGGDHETTAAEAAELARLAAEHRAFAPEDGDRTRPGQDPPVEDLIISNRDSYHVLRFVRDELRQQRLPAPVAGPRGRQPRAGPHTARRDGRTAGAGMTVVEHPAAATAGPGRRRHVSGPGRRLADAAPGSPRSGPPASCSASAARSISPTARSCTPRARPPPGLDVLLTTGGTLDAEGWRDAVAQAGADGGSGGSWSTAAGSRAGALELCHLGALYDAAYFALGPSSAPGALPLRGRALARPRAPRAGGRRGARDPAPPRPAAPHLARPGDGHAPRWCAPAAPPAPPVPPRQRRGTRPGGRRPHGRRTSRWRWAARRSTPWSTYGGSPRRARDDPPAATRPAPPSGPEHPLPDPGHPADQAPEQPPPALDRVSPAIQASADPDVALLRRLRDALEAL